MINPNNPQESLKCWMIPCQEHQALCSRSSADFASGCASCSTQCGGGLFLVVFMHQHCQEPGHHSAPASWARMAEIEVFAETLDLCQGLFPGHCRVKALLSCTGKCCSSWSILEEKVTSLLQDLRRDHPPTISPCNCFETVPHLQELLVCKCHDAFEDNHIGAIQGFLWSQNGCG